MRRRREHDGDVLILGAGNVGTSLQRACRAHGVRSRLLSARRVRDTSVHLHRSPWLVVLAVRDGELGAWAARLATTAWITNETAVAHVAGRMAADVLTPLRAGCAGVAQMHPLLSLVASAGAPLPRNAHVQVSGDAEAVRRCCELARRLGLRPRTSRHLDLTAYHAAAALVANGTVALADAGAQLLRLAGADADAISGMLSGLLASVVANLAALGVPQALTGPVRRGDAAAVGQHVATLSRVAPHLVPLYRALALAQLPMATVLGEAAPDALEETARRLRE